MKSNTIKHSVPAIVIAAASILTASPFTAVKAGIGRKDKVATQNMKAPELSTNYLGEVDNCVLIRIATSQDRDQRSFLRIYDNNGELLMEEMIFTRNSVKLIKVSPAELSNIHIVYSSFNQEAKKQLAIRSITETSYTIAEVPKQK